MHQVHQENLPFVGSSYEFVGAEQDARSLWNIPQSLSETSPALLQ